MYLKSNTLRRCLVVVCLALGAWGGVCAQTPAPNNTAPAPAPANSAENYDRLPFMEGNERQTADNGPSALGLMMRTLGALLLIVGLIVAAGWGLRRFGGYPFGLNNPTEESEVTVVSQVPLGQQSSLAVVRFNGRTLLIGRTPTSFTLLATGTEEEPFETTRPARSVSEMLEERELASFSQELETAVGNTPPAEQLPV